VSDLHVRILRLVARRTQRELDDDNAVEHAVDTASTGRRDYLMGAASRNRTRVVDAQARRRDRQGGLGS
jgi:hypothetical protein